MNVFLYVDSYKKEGRSSRADSLLWFARASVTALFLCPFRWNESLSTRPSLTVLSTLIRSRFVGVP